MPWSFIFSRTWNWLVDTGLTLFFLILLAFLVPRVGRFAMRMVEKHLTSESEQKTQLAFAGVAIYIIQILAYFLIFVLALQQLGFSLAGAAIPATVASAAIGLGAQSIIADFLAGFFILSEKQYGVGDWVRFEGGATTVEGTVIQITMRATRIRTLAEETVIIPNSKAGVPINNSNYWSSAVVTMPIPLLGSTSISQAISRAEQAAKKALLAPEVAREVLGELTVHESVGINAPSIVGMPWTVDMRFLCQVKPASQWMVERAIRTSIIDEFWPEYGSAPTLDGTVVTDLSLADGSVEIPETHTEQTSPQVPDANYDRLAPPAGFSDREYQQVLGQTAPNLAVEEEIHASTDPAAHPSRLQRLLTANGRTRASTSVLILLAIALVILKGLTLDSGEEDGARGWLAPTRSSVTSTPEPLTPAPAPSPEITPPPVEPSPTLEPEFTTEAPLTEEEPSPAPSTPEVVDPLQELLDVPEPTPAEDTTAAQP